jgi:hypothetical protein
MRDKREMREERRERREEERGERGRGGERRGEKSILVLVVNGRHLKRFYGNSGEQEKKFFILFLGQRRLLP